MTNSTEEMNNWLSIVEQLENFRWPRKGDRLIRNCPNWNQGGEFSEDINSRHVHISDGYMIAAKILIDNCEAGNPKKHSLIYPILFNYRHAIELEMKWIIRIYGQHSTAKIDDFRHHNLLKLWNLCKSIIIEIGSEDEAMQVVEQVVKDFHELDRSGQVFRYYSSKNGIPVSLPDYPIDLQNIRDVMEGVANFFLDVDGRLDANSSATDF